MQPANIAVVSVGKHKFCLLIDLGMSRSAVGSGPTQGVDSQAWTAVEAFIAYCVSELSVEFGRGDVHALGVVLAELLCTAIERE